MQLALHHLSLGDVTLAQLSENATTESIYNPHLRNLLWDLQKYPDLVDALKRVVMSPTPIDLETVQSFKLQSKGLVKIRAQQVVPSCHLYRKYFAQVLAVG